MSWKLEMVWSLLMSSLSINISGDTGISALLAYGTAMAWMTSDMYMLEMRGVSHHSHELPLSCADVYAPPDVILLQEHNALHVA